MSRETVWIDIVVKDDRGLAWYVNNGHKDIWIPKSQVLDTEEDLGRGIATRIEVPLWLAEDKGLV